MIVRILTEGQYELHDRSVEEVKELDREIVEAVRAGHEERFHEVFPRLVELVRREGSELEDDDLRLSELMLPPPDISFAEAQEEFTGEGLIPD